MIVASLWLGSISLGAGGPHDEGLRPRRRQPASASSSPCSSPPAWSARRSRSAPSSCIFSKPVETRAVHLRQVPRARRDPGLRARRHGTLPLPRRLGCGRSRQRRILLAATVLIYLQVLVIVAVTMLLLTVTSAILASVLGITSSSAGQLSHNVLSLTGSAPPPRSRDSRGSSSSSSRTSTPSTSSRPSWARTPRLGTHSGLGALPGRLRGARPRRGVLALQPQGVLSVRRVLAIVVVVICVAVVIGFQATRPVNAAGNPRVFVPSPRFFEKLAPSFRTSIADAYWLGTVQYYGEHVGRRPASGLAAGDARPGDDAEPAVHRALPLRHLLALVDAGEPQMAYDLLERGFKANPRDWRLPFQLGFLRTPTAPTRPKRRPRRSGSRSPAGCRAARRTSLVWPPSCSRRAASARRRPSCGARSTRTATSTPARRRSPGSRRSCPRRSRPA